MIETKFKQTEIGLIPEDWNVYKISDIASVTTGSRNTQDRCPGGKYPFYVRSQEIERINSYSFDTEGVITAGDGVGTGKVYHYVNGKFELHQRAYLIYAFNGISPKYFYKYFSQNFYERVSSMTAKSSVDSVRKEMITDMQIAVPKSLAEQQRIASALTSVDNLLSSLDKLIAKKRDIKQGAMQQLLTGKTRLKGFTEPWRNCVVQNICNITTGASNAQDQVENGIYPFYIRSEQIVRSNKYLFDGEAVITIGDGQIGKVFHYVNGKFDLHQRCYVMRNFNGVDAKFFYYYFSANFYERAMSMTAKATVDSVRMEMIADMPINIPSSIVEQQRIAKTLTLIDDEIAALEAKRKKYEAVKQGMMQQLLTGKIRLL